MCGVTGMLKSVDQDTVYTRFQSGVRIHWLLKMFYLCVWHTKPNIIKLPALTNTGENTDAVVINKHERGLFIIWGFYVINQQKSKKNKNSCDKYWEWIPVTKKQKAETRH